MTYREADLLDHINRLEAKLAKLSSVEMEAVWLAQENDRLRFEHQAAGRAMDWAYWKLTDSSLNATEEAIGILWEWLEQYYDGRIVG